MADITLDAETFCRYRDNPWDERAFALKTRELLELRYRDVTKLSELLDAFETRNRDDHVGLCLTRISADDRILRTALAAAGYDAVENSYALSLGSLVAFYPVNAYGRILPLRAAVAADIPILQTIAAEDFSYGRFAEDPRIPVAACAQRQRNWIADMAADKNFTIWVTGPVAAPTGFHAFRQHDTHADMILTRHGAGAPASRRFFLGLVSARYHQSRNDDSQHHDFRRQHSRGQSLRPARLPL